VAKGTCSIDGCDRAHQARGVCRYHYVVIRDSGTSITYSSVHSALVAQRGRARHQACVDCSQPAREWSYDHTDDNELTSGTGARFSTDIQRYVPRCKPCHRAFDAVKQAEHLRALATDLEQPIRHAIAERKRAQEDGDLAAYDYWDAELERLTAPLKTQRLA